MYKKYYSCIYAWHGKRSWNGKNNDWYTPTFIHFLYISLTWGGFYSHESHPCEWVCKKRVNVDFFFFIIFWIKNDFCKIKTAQFGPTCMGSTNIYWLCKNYSLLVVQLTHSGWNKNMIFCHFKTQLLNTILCDKMIP